METPFINYKDILFFITLSYTGLITAYETVDPTHSEQGDTNYQKEEKGSHLSLVEISNEVIGMFTNIKVSQDAKFIAGNGLRNTYTYKGAVPTKTINIWKNEGNRLRHVSTIKEDRADIYNCDDSPLTHNDDESCHPSHLPRNIRADILAILATRLAISDPDSLDRRSFISALSLLGDTPKPSPVLDFSFNRGSNKTDTIITSSRLGVEHYDQLTGRYTKSTSYSPSFLNEISDDYLYMANVRLIEKTTYKVEVYKRKNEEEEESLFKIIHSVFHSGAVNDLAFSYDNKLLASASDDMTIEVLDLNAGTAKVIKTNAPVKQVFFDSENNIVSLDAEHRIFIHRKQGEEWQTHEVTVYHPSSDNIKSIAVHTRSNTLAVAYKYGKALLFARPNNSDTYEATHSVKLPAVVDHLVFSHNEDFLVSFDAQRSMLTLWKLSYTE